MASSREELKWKASPHYGFLWPWQSNPDPWDKTRVAEWTPYLSELSLTLEQAYRRKLKVITINTMYFIDFQNLVQQLIDDLKRQRSIRRRCSVILSSVSSNDDNLEECSLAEWLFAPLERFLSCSTSFDTKYYGRDLLRIRGWNSPMENWRLHPILYFRSL